MGATVDEHRYDQGGPAFGPPANINREGQGEGHQLPASLEPAGPLGGRNRTREYSFSLGVPFGEIAVGGIGHHLPFTFSSRAISRSRYQRAFLRSSSPGPFSPARQTYLTTLPRQKFMCSVISMHSTPEGCA